jgi:ATP phosphoribosyltransferase regulatory subunit
LATIGLDGLHLDLGHVGVFRALAAAAGLTPEREAAIFEILQRKARPELDALLAETELSAAQKERFAALTELNGGAEVLAAARARLAGAGPGVASALDNLGAVADAVAESHPALERYFDLAELRGYRYYTGVVYAVFLPGQGQALAQGGRYDGIGKAFGRERAATGFSADLRRLVKLLPEDGATCSGVLAPAGGTPALRAEIARLRADGERVVEGLPGTGGDPQETGCDRRLVERGGKWSIEKI